MKGEGVPPSSRQDVSRDPEGYDFQEKCEV